MVYHWYNKWYTKWYTNGITWYTKWYNMVYQMVYQWYTMHMDWLLGLYMLLHPLPPLAGLLHHDAMPLVILELLLPPLARPAVCFVATAATTTTTGAALRRLQLR